MSFAYVKLAAGAGLVASFATAAAAGGCPIGGFLGNHHHAASCLPQLRTPDVYRTVERQVVVRPGYTETVRTPAVMGYQTRQVQVTPPRSETVTTPAVYGTQTRQVMVRPARVEARQSPATTKTVYETVIVTPAHDRWEMRPVIVSGHGGHHGHRSGHWGHKMHLGLHHDYGGHHGGHVSVAAPQATMMKCKVHVPAVTQTVARQVTVPGQSYAVHIPAEYRTVTERVLLQPASSRIVHTPGTYDWVKTPVVIRPASVETIQHPPVMGVVQEKILVQQGGTSWQPADGHHGWSGYRHGTPIKQTVRRPEPEADEQAPARPSKPAK